MSDVLKTASPTADAALAPNATPGQTLPSSRTSLASFLGQGAPDAEFALAATSRAALARRAEAEGRGKVEEVREHEQLVEVEAAEPAVARAPIVAGPLLALLIEGADGDATALRILRACMGISSGRGFFYRAFLPCAFKGRVSDVKWGGEREREKLVAASKKECERGFGGKKIDTKVSTNKTKTPESKR